MNVKDARNIYKILRHEFPANGLLTPSLLQAIIDVLLMYEFEGDKGQDMKKVMIDGKEYWQQEECDIPKIQMPYPKDLLNKYQPERLNLEVQDFENGWHRQDLKCDSPTPDNKENQGITQK